jgi:hypothetical protein
MTPFPHRSKFWWTPEFRVGGRESLLNAPVRTD